MVGGNIKVFCYEMAKNPLKKLLPWLENILKFTLLKCSALANIQNVSTLKNLNFQYLCELGKN